MGVTGQNEFIEKHRGLVRSIAQKIRAQYDLSIDLAELEAFGFEGLLEAHRRFDPSRGVQFNTFAYYRVRGAVIDGVRQLAFLPRRVHAQLKALDAGDRVSESAGELRAADPERRSDPAKTLADVDQTLHRMTASFVIASLGQSEEDDAPATPEQRLLDGETARRVRDVVAKLPERERALIEGFYFDGRRFDEVATELGISKSWASRLHTKALDILREALEG